MADNPDIAARWAALGQMDRAALRVAWAAAFGDAPPHFMSMIFMRKALIWDAQCRVFGGLTTDVKRALSDVASPETNTAKNATRRCLDVVERIDIAPGEIRVALTAELLAVALDVDQTRINDALLTVTSPFQHRKRGVETRLIIGDEPADIDATLLRNIARAHRYFDLVRSGKTFAEIADSEGVSKRRVQQLIELAFLAPDVIRTVREGRQPVGMTSDWLKRHAFSPIWTEQRDAFAAL